VSTITEIEEAISRLALADRETLESRIFAHRFGLDALDNNLRSQLLASLDEADSQIDSGKGISANELKRNVRAWSGR